MVSTHTWGHLPRTWTAYHEPHPQRRDWLSLRPQPSNAKRYSKGADILSGLTLLNLVQMNTATMVLHNYYVLQKSQKYSTLGSKMSQGQGKVGI